MKKVWIIVGSIIGVVVLTIAAWVGIDLMVTTRAEVAANLIYEALDEIESKGVKDFKRANGSFSLNREFFTVEDVTKIGKDEDNADYFLVTYRLNGAKMLTSVVKVEEKNGELKGDFVDRYSESILWYIPR